MGLSSHARSVCALLVALLATAQSSRGLAPATIPRFTRGENPVALTGPARPQRYLEASGRRAAFLGREDGSFEAWVYPLKVAHGLELSFGTPAYADPIPGASLASSVDVRPEAAVVRYAHDSFTADAIWLVPIDEPGGLVLLDVNTSVPLDITVKFRIDLKPMWPAALGGQSSYWDDTVKAYVAGEASRKHAALVGSPLARTPPVQPAHNLPDAPSQFTISVTPEDAARGLIPIAIAASHEGAPAARTIYARLLGSAESLYRATDAHYRRLREELASIETPDPRIDLAFEWGKVALDKGFVCNPHLGCGLIAGLGPSGRTERPGFGWFFGGDAFMNSWAMSAYGDHATVKQTIEFLRRRQRADGKMMHELSQGAGYLRWFEEFPYGYYHADTTPLYIIATRDYVRASGDLGFAKEAWPSIRKAYDYCVSTDEDGDGLMDNTKAGLAAVETGKLRRADVLTDVFLAAVWTDAAGAAAELAAIAGDTFAETARAAHAKARVSINQRFLDDDGRRIYYAWMKSGRGEAEATAWAAVGIWRGVFDATRPAVAGMLDELARPGIAADWGARLLSRESGQYEPQSYNNGAVWPFLSGFVTLALYSQHRADAAWQYLDGTADLAFIDGRGYVTELLSGDRLRPIDASVPHQLFSTSGFVSGFMRGLVGLREPPAADAAAALVLEPQLPAGWDRLSVRRLRWRDAVIDVRLERTPGGITVAVLHSGTPRPVVVRPGLPPGAEPTRGSSGELRLPGRQVRESASIDVQPGIEIAPVHAPMRLGDLSQRLRVISTSFDGRRFVARLEGRRGRTYTLRASVPFRIESIVGGDARGSMSPAGDLVVTIPGDGDGWAPSELVITVGRRMPNASRGEQP
jgi:glycogen debranching enzyme